MPAVQQKPPEKIRPYLFHQVIVDWKNPQRGANGEQYAMGNCPLCSKDGKFHVDIESGLYGCFKCEESGNVYTFLRWLHEKSVEATREYSPLSVDRALLNGVGLAQWEICRSILTDDWLIPGYGIDGKLNQLYRYMFSPVDHRMVTWPTPGPGHQIHGMNLYKPDNLINFVCEGWSDGVSLWEIMSQTKQTDDGLALTSNYESSLLTDANVLAIPTASTFFDSWCALFSGKVVNLMLDNDHPRIHPKTKEEVDGAGLHHSKRIAAMLANYKEPPDQINVLKWSEIGYNKGLPSGFDTRDKLSLTEEELAEKM